MVGQKLGSYNILAEIGAGGMGVVYLGKHRHLGRKVAIKVLLKESANRPDLLERFFAEALATSMIQHPGIVGIFDCETDALGHPYIVMEYLEGETLGAHLSRRGALPTLEAVTIARRVAEALGAAHARGIIHRDLKPENVFMLANPPGAIKLVDFGIAKLTAEFQRGQQSRTQTGEIIGTPLYMSPEQCRGVGAIDHRTDIYSLGCLLFDMLTGRPPFQLEGLGELVAAHLTQEPPGVQTLVPELPEAVDLAVHQLLRKAPGDRPQTMGEVVALLRELGAPSLVPGEPTVVPAPNSSPAAATMLPSRWTDSSGARRRTTTFGQSTGEMRDAATVVPAAPTRRSGSLLVGGAVVLAAIGVTVVAMRRGSVRDAAQGVPAAIETQRAVAPPPQQPPPAVQPPGGDDEAGGGEPPRVRSLAGVGRSRPDRPALPIGKRPRAAIVRAPASDPNRSVKVMIDSEPPGAEVCAVSDRRLLGHTSAAVLVPLSVKVASFYVGSTGYHTRRVDVIPGREKRHFVPLQPLGPDDLDSPSPCVR